MLSRYDFKASDIIKIFYHYEGKYPTYAMQGSYSTSEYFSLASNMYGLSKFQEIKLIAKLKADKIIYQQKYCAGDNYKRSIFWLDTKEIMNQLDIYPIIKRNVNISNRLTSVSLEEDLDMFSEKSATLKNATYALSISLSDKNDRHFTINNTGKMTYTPRGRMTVLNDDENKWSSSNKFRSEIKIGKGLRKIYSNQSIKISEKDIEYLTNKLKGKYTFLGKISKVSGADIRTWYNGDNYARSNTESLGNSCMRHTSCSDYFDIYTKNSDKVQMIIATDDDNLLIGRAILWITDSHGLFCDRIYGNSVTIEAIKTYAKSIGAYVKKEQSYSNAEIVSTTGELIEDEITITLTKGGFDYYPYMDTLKYADDINNKDEIILNSSCGNYELESTDGGPNDSVTLENGDRVREENARYIDRFDEYVHEDDAVYSDYSSEYIMYNRAIEIDNGNDYVWDDNEDFVFVEDKNCYYHTDYVQYSDYSGEWIHDDDVVECVIHGTIHGDNMQVIKVGDKEFRCHDDVTINDLLDEELITEEDYAEYEN